MTPSDAIIEHLPTREGYDRWAVCYDSDENPLVVIEEPLVDGLLGNVHGLAVADIGCGTGRHALRMAQAGAAVSAVDFSQAMLATALAKAVGFSIDFRLHDLAEPLPWPDAAFDRVVCGLVLDHVAALEPLFREMGRVCRPAGFIVASIMHPAMMLRGVQARFRDPDTGRETRPASVAHQISDYVIAAVRGGLAIDHLSEHAIGEDLADRHERAAKYLGWPILFLMRLRPGLGGIG